MEKQKQTVYNPPPTDPPPVMPVVTKQSDLTSIAAVQGPHTLVQSGNKTV